MISTLQRSLKLKKEYTDVSSDLRMNEHEVIARLYYLLNNLSEKRQLDLFRQFLNGSTAKFLLKMAIDMSQEQRFIFMKRVEEMQPETEKPDRRAQARKNCLINVNFKIRGQKFSSYILDISGSGAFIETNESFPCGLKMLLSFSSPEDRQPLNLIGEIVWSDARGSGVKFHHLTKDQTGILKSFSEKPEEVLEIDS
ncbi:MAG: PilZ domain-containing protein [Desulfobacterales bacterium]